MVNLLQMMSIFGESWLIEVFTARVGYFVRMRIKNYELLNPGKVTCVIFDTRNEDYCREIHGNYQLAELIETNKKFLSYSIEFFREKII